MITSTVHFGPKHPLASVAAQHCQSHYGDLVGGVACGECWELAIRDDERIAVEFGLPRELKPDPDFVDEIAVRLACQGARVALTPGEFVTAVHRLSGQRLHPIEIARRLHTTYRTVARELANQQPDDDVREVNTRAVS